MVQVSGYKPITPSFQATSPCYSHDSIHGEIEAINGSWLHEGVGKCPFFEHIENHPTKKGISSPTNTCSGDGNQITKKDQKGTWKPTPVQCGFHPSHLDLLFNLDHRPTF